MEMLLPLHASHQGEAFFFFHPVSKCVIANYQQSIKLFLFLASGVYVMEGKERNAAATAGRAWAYRFMMRFRVHAKVQDQPSFHLEPLIPLQQLLF